MTDTATSSVTGSGKSKGGRPRENATCIRHHSKRAHYPRDNPRFCTTGCAAELAYELTSSLKWNGHAWPKRAISLFKARLSEVLEPLMMVVLGSAD